MTTKYRALLGFNFWSKTEGQKRRRGEDYTEIRVEPGDLISATKLSGAKISDLIAAGAIEKDEA